MALVCPTEHICYVRCTYCDTLLAVGVPCNWLMDRVTVNCGRCNNLSFIDPRHLLQCLCPTSHHMSFQGPCSGCRGGGQPNFLRSSIPASSEHLFNVNGAPFGVRMPKKHRAPSAYNHFMRDEIQRIKAANPEIPHREAFSMAAKNWAKCDPRNSSNVST